ncbi:MAG TPA: Fe-S cluster assembly ATPase SufC [Pseudomonadales bacterium]|nr:Fe-S cluster assembly ATPase SufC [Pseudomonadales bacterium]
MLEIDDLHVTVAGTPILKGLTLDVAAGEVAAIMGPNGSGKSTLANVVAGRPGYDVTHGTIRYRGESLVDLAPEARARAGVFLAFQYPVEIPGVSNMEFLKASLDAHRTARGEVSLSAVDFMKRVRAVAASLDLSPEFLKRGVNEGFSGGEKKRNEILQLLVLEPMLAILDETDSGLDIDALQVVAGGVNRFRSKTNGILLVTHYQRLLEHIVPDTVHVLADGRIVKSGDRRLALELEEKGYGWITDAA